jgi:hypothetical protein
MMQESATTVRDDLDSDMAVRAAQRKVKTDDTLVSRYIGLLIAAKLNREVFEGTLTTLATDTLLSPADVIEIAQRYRGGGTKPTSRKAALEVISKRFLELVRSQAQIEQASKARPW